MFQQILFFLRSSPTRVAIQPSECCTPDKVAAEETEIQSLHMQTLFAEISADNNFYALLSYFIIFWKMLSSDGPLSLAHTHTRIIVCG